jgi:GDPmannose 4,6-dehydratase
MDENYLIIGAGGQDGTFLTKLLLKKNKKVHLVGNNLKVKKNKNIFKHNLDISNTNSVNKLLSKFKNLKIFFLASHNIPSIAEESSELHYKNLSANVTSLVNFLEYIATKNKKMKLFYACSSQIYNNTNTTSQNELTIPEFNTNYALSKFLGKNICDYYRKEKKIFCSTGIMYSHVSKISKKQFLIKEILTQLRSNNTKTVVNNANAKIDITSVVDVVSAMFKIINLKKTDNFIISTNKLVTVREIIRKLEKILNLKKRNIISLKKKNNKKITVLKGINKKIYRECNWRPLYKLDDILASFAEV